MMLNLAYKHPFSFKKSLLPSSYLRSTSVDYVPIKATANLTITVPAGYTLIVYCGESIVASSTHRAMIYRLRPRDQPSYSDAGTDDQFVNWTIDPSVITGYPSGAAPAVCMLGAAKGHANCPSTGMVNCRVVAPNMAVDGHYNVPGEGYGDAHTDIIPGERLNYYPTTHGGLHPHAPYAMKPKHNHARYAYFPCTYDATQPNPFAYECINYVDHVVSTSGQAQKRAYGYLEFEAMGQDAIVSVSTVCYYAVTFANEAQRRVFGRREVNFPCDFSKFYRAALPLGSGGTGESANEAFASSVTSAHALNPSSREAPTHAGEATAQPPRPMSTTEAVEKDAEGVAAVYGTVQAAKGLASKAKNVLGIGGNEAAATAATDATLADTAAAAATAGETGGVMSTLSSAATGLAELFEGAWPLLAAV